jgi:hypothetical protein
VQLTAVFESWHIGDGNYPPLHRGQIVRLSFELQARRLSSVKGSLPPGFIHAGEARYSGVGIVLRHYATDGDEVAIIEAGSLRFYVNGPKAKELRPEGRVQFEGTLQLDHYLWVEFLGRYADPPDLFYNLRVQRIRKVGIPERFVSRHATGMSYPTTVDPLEFEAVEELETMEGQDFGLEFYIIDFDDAGLEGLEVPLTFR